MLDHGVFRLALECHVSQLFEGFFQDSHHLDSGRVSLKDHLAAQEQVIGT